MTPATLNQSYRLAFIAALAVGCVPAMHEARASAVADVSAQELSGLQQLYAVDNNAFSFNAAYTVDNSGSIASGSFTRVAYYVELGPIGNTQWVWVSMNTFDPNPLLVGVPKAGSGVVENGTLVTNLHIESNHPNVTPGTSANGIIEFWASNYNQNGGGLFGSSDANFDWKDSGGNSGAGHGSFQVFSLNSTLSSGTTLFGITSNGGSGIGDQIGNPGAPDWTFGPGIGTYAIRNVEVWVGTPVFLTPEPSTLALAGLGMIFLAGRRKKRNVVKILTRTLALLVVALGLIASDVEQAHAGAAEDLSVADREGMIRLYSLDIPNTYNFHTGGVPYNSDLTALVTSGSYDRVAYYMELKTPTGNREWVWASMDSFDADPTKLGVPNSTSGISKQQNVTNMNVRSNKTGITTGNGIATGNIEFWPNNYNATNSAGVPGASGSVYDFGDNITTPVAGHGSMQVHNHGAGETLFGFNRLNGSGSMGIGTQSPAVSGATDWTFAPAASTYDIKHLEVWVNAPKLAASIAAPSNIVANVPQAAPYNLLYQLAIPNAADFDSVGPNYTVDNSAAHADGNFSRVAYYMELEHPSLGSQWVYVSADAFSHDPTLLGVPTLASGAQFQQILSNMDVFSNVGNITDGLGFDTGNIEFWPYNYSTANGAGIPGASDSVYDFGDTINLTGFHGSMQIHNFGEGETLFSYNNWNAGTTSSLGIGNSLIGNPDWTLQTNAGGYTLKNLYVLVYVTPEPSTVLMCGLGLIGLLARRRRGVRTALAALVCFVAATSASSDARANVFSNVSEAGRFQTLYSLDIPNNPDFDTNGISYAIDRTADFAGKNIHRIAYYLELTDGGGTDWVYASMDPFTQNVNHLGVPTFASGAIHQQILSNMNVFSNAGAIVQGEGIETGNIEFWPTNYSQPNAIGIPGANAGTYDFGDTQVASGAFGSMQIHNHGAGQTLFAFNDWNDTSNAGLGIGNNPSGEPDWTFVTNSGTYSFKQLNVLVEIIPEPSTVLLCSLGLVGLVSRRRRGLGSTNRSTKTHSTSTAIATLFAVVCFAVSSQAHANLIVNPSFETPDRPFNSSTNYNTGTQMDAANWPISANSITLVDSSFGTVASDGGQWLSLEANPGSIGNPGAISQTFTTHPGRLYDVAFDYSALSDGVINSWTLSYGVAGPTETVGINTSSTAAFALVPWATETFQFLAVGPTTTLSFLGQQQRAGFYGPAIDNVSVVLVTPEPTSMLLVASLVMLSLTGRTRRRRNR